MQSNRQQWLIASANFPLAEFFLGLDIKRIWKNFYISRLVLSLVQTQGFGYRNGQPIDGGRASHSALLS